MSTDKSAIKKKSDPDDLKSTIFIRNLAFDATNEILMEKFEGYGRVEFARVVRHASTGLSKGVAFVKFKNAVTKDAVLLKAMKADNDEEFSLQGRRMNISAALSREEASRMDSREDNRQHKQNAHLATIGLIRAGTNEAQHLTPDDLNRMETLLQRKKNKLKDPNVFVSDRRLCVHNLPVDLSDKDLLKVCKKHGGPGCYVSECRIMRNVKKVGRSLGFAFVAFEKPDHALNCLKSMNCNPKVFEDFGQDKKPFVEFSLENRRAVLVKENRLKKTFTKDKDDIPSKAGVSGPGKAPEFIKHKTTLPKHLKAKKGRVVKNKNKGMAKKSFTKNVKKQKKTK